MPPIDEPAPSESKSSAPEARKQKTASTASEPPSGPALVSLTIEAATGRIVKVEGMDAQGTRRELSEEERARLAKTEAGVTLQDVVEQAFEAGIACVLGDRGDDEGDAPESDDDADLSRMLLRSLLAHSAAKRLMRQEILGPAIVGTLVERAASFAPAATKTAATH